MTIISNFIRNLIFVFIYVLIMSTTAHAEEITDAVKATLGPKACANCHKNSVRAWKETHHFKTFTALTKDEDAKGIAEKMGIKRMKNESDCLDCHFSSTVSGGKNKVVAGISCESCHGPARDWMDVHSDFGGKGVKSKDETPEHKKERYAKAEKNGMIRPSNLYNVGKNCYGCHTVPNEKLVNVGGHAAGSDFELVQWSQGEVRHNVWYNEKSNVPATPERLRMMYIVGKALDLEYALRGLAKATEDKDYFKSMVKRQENALSDLKKIAGSVNDSQIKSVIAAVNSGDIKINNQAALSAAADKVGKATQEFAKQNDGGKFASIDGLLPKPGDYKGTVFQP